MNPETLTHIEKLERAAQVKKVKDQIKNKRREKRINKIKNIFRKK